MEQPSVQDMGTAPGSQGEGAGVNKWAPPLSGTISPAARSIVRAVRKEVAGEGSGFSDSSDYVINVVDSDQSGGSNPWLGAKTVAPLLHHNVSYIESLDNHHHSDRYLSLSITSKLWHILSNRTVL